MIFFHQFMLSLNFKNYCGSDRETDSSAKRLNPELTAHNGRENLRTKNWLSSLRKAGVFATVNFFDILRRLTLRRRSNSRILYGGKPHFHFFSVSGWRFTDRFNFITITQVFLLCFFLVCVLRKRWFKVYRADGG